MLIKSNRIALQTHKVDERTFRTPCIVTSSYIFLDEKTMLEIWLNPGLNLTIFRGTGPRCESVKVMFSLFFLSIIR